MRILISRKSTLRIWNCLTFRIAMGWEELLWAGPLGNFLISRGTRTIRFLEMLERWAEKYMNLCDRTSDRAVYGQDLGFFLYPESRPSHFLTFLGFFLGLGFYWPTGPGSAQVNKSNPEFRPKISISKALPLVKNFKNSFLFSRSPALPVKVLDLSQKNWKVHWLL